MLRLNVNTEEIKKIVLLKNNSSDPKLKLGEKKRGKIFWLKLNMNL